MGVNFGYLTVIFEAFSRRLFYKVGKTNADHPYKVIIGCIIFTIFCATGLRFQEELTETRSEKLWVPQESRAFDDQSFLIDNFGEEDKVARYLSENRELGEEGNVLTAAHVQEAFQLELITMNIVTSYKGKTYSLMGSENDIRLCRASYDYRTVNVPPLSVPCSIRSIFTVWSYNAQVINALTDTQLLIDLNAYYNRTSSSGIGVPVDAFLGQIVFTPGSCSSEGCISAAGAMLTTYYLDGRYNKDTLPLDASEKWQDDYLADVEDFDKDKNLIGIYHRFASVTNEREVSAAASAGTSLVLISIGFIFIFLSFSFAKADLIRSQILLGFLGVAVILIGIITGIGLGLWMGIKYTPITQVIVFLVLGMGVANYIILAESFEETDPLLNVEERNANALSHAGAFVFLTNGTTIIAFLVGSNSNFPAVHAFGLDAAVVCTINFIYNLTMWDAMLVLSAKRVLAGRMDCCCIKLARPYSVSGALEDDGKHDDDHEILQKVIKNYLAPLVPTKLYRISVLVFFGILLILGFWGVSQIQEGLDLKDVVADDSYYTEFYGLTADYFDKYGPFLNIIIGQNEKPDVNGYLLYHLPESRAKMYELQSQLRELDQIDPNVPITFLFDYYDQFRTAVGLPNPAPDEVSYLMGLTAFFRFNQTNPDGSLTFPFASFQNDVNIATDFSHVIASRMKTFHISTMKTSQELTDALDSTRKCMSNSALAEDGVEMIAFANDYIVWDSFSRVRTECFRNLVVSIICVFLVLLCLLHPGASALVVLVIFMMDIIILAWIPLMSLELNSVTTICIIMSVGMAVDYSAHIAHAFQVNEGTRPQRAAKAVSDMGRAIVSGAFATFLGILMLSIAPTAINRTFFIMMGGVAVVGMVHGLFLLPVIMSYIGPEFADPNSLRTQTATPSLNKASLLSNQY